MPLVWRKLVVVQTVHSGSCGVESILQRGEEPEKEWQDADGQADDAGAQRCHGGAE